MARIRTQHRCTECGATTFRWAGRCPTCEAWGSLEEEVVPAATASSVALRPASSSVAPLPICDLDADAGTPVPTGIGELDRVLGGGLVPGSVTLVGGEPGIGKSTLLLQAVASLAANGATCLLICAEESAQQVRRRAERLGAAVPGVWLVAETDLPAIRTAVEKVSPDVMVVDSIQTIWDPDAEAPPGSVTQVKTCAQALTTLAKATDTAVLLVGHVTKEGSLAGPRVLEHLVDTVLTFDGERHHALRLLRSTKHRFGSTGELGLFEMGEIGLIGVPDPSGLFLGDRRVGTPGSAVFPAMEGYRPLLVEVLHQSAQVGLGDQDVYVSAVGGVRLAEPGVDLALCLALVSASTGRPLPSDLVVVGEVGLGGEIRQVGHTPRRLAEAARLGFGRAVVPSSAPPVTGMTNVGVATLAEAIARVLPPGGGAGRVV
jgi:DNA repair protein RadA/Sms